MRKSKMWISLYIVLSLSGCVSSSSETAISPSSTSSPIVSTTLLPEKTLSYQCLEVAPHIPAGALPQGWLLLFGEHPFLLDLETGVRKELNDGQGELSVSPSGKWLASRYVDEDNKIWLLVETLVDPEQKLIHWNDDWFLLGGWLDHEHVWVSHYTEPLVTVVNPFSGEQQELVPDFPGLETVTQAGEHFVLGASSVVYNSSLKLAVYPRLESDGYVYVVLWDLQSNRILSKVKDISDSFSYLPLWSLDQKEIYVAVADKWDSNRPDILIYDFFSLSQDGQIRQLTDFGATFADTYIGSASLSPDGKKIAFWLKARPSSYKDQQLAVLDLDTLQVTNYCVPGSFQGDAPSPVWSLDGHYLAVYNQYEPNAGRVILVDIQQGWAAQVAEIVPNGWPAGWMAAP